MKKSRVGVRLCGVTSLALSLFAQTAHAESWLQVAELDRKGSVLLLETTAIDRTTDRRQAWFKSVFASDRPIPDGFRDVPPGVRTYRWQLDLGQFNCKERTIALSKSTLHGADDKVVGTAENSQADLKFRELPPQSSGWLMIQSVCSSPTPEGKPEPPLARLKSIVNPDDYYPSSARRRGETGAPIVKVCIGPSGTLLRAPEVTESSGFPDLDGAAVKAAQSMRYTPAIENGAAAPESCIKYKIQFKL